MSLLTTSAASIHQLGAALAFGDSAQLRKTDGDHLAITTWWNWRIAIANATMAAAWVIEQRTIRKNPRLDRVTNDAVRTKDMCVIGATITNVANVIVGQLAARKFPKGVPVTLGGELLSQAPPGARKYQRYFQVMAPLNRAFVAGAIGFTPFVNFDILKSYHPGILYRLFT